MAADYRDMVQVLLNDFREAQRAAEEASERAAAAARVVEQLQAAIEALGSLLPDGRSALDGNHQSLRSPVEDGDDGKRPTTEWVTAIVLEADRPMRRSEVQGEVERIHGIPTNWSDPAEVIGVALSRAASRGLLTRAGRGFYAPKGWSDQVGEADVA